MSYWQIQTSNTFHDNLTKNGALEGSGTKANPFTQWFWHYFDRIGQKISKFITANTGQIDFSIPNDSASNWNIKEIQSSF